MPEQSPLDAYHAKRSPEQTPEPFGEGTATEAGLFVVQKHAARRTHYDLRLELGGVLLSWAVPRGPSYDQKDKRLAVHVEDHPIEYAEFEGLIPEGNYGAGAMIVWDRGRWIPRGDPQSMLEEGKLLFELRGYKLNGLWTLVKTKQDWLLIKERDAWLKEEDGSIFPEESVLSGLTVEELKDPADRTRPIHDLLEQHGAPPRVVDVAEVQIMLAQTRETPFSSPDWVFELKYDGYRMLAARLDGKPRLLSRNGNDLTASFPEIARAVQAWPYDGFILDGEVVVNDEYGHPRFQLLQQRARLSRGPDIHRASIALPAVFYSFDLLAFEGHDVRPLPLVVRKELLRMLLPSTGPIRFSEHFEGQGEALYQQVVRMRLEGVVAKRAGSAYEGGRSDEWLKIRADRTDDFVVVGYSDPKGARGGFGALHLAGYRGDTLTYTGRVGTGFTERDLKGIREQLEALHRGDPPCDGDVPSGTEHHWVDPELVCEVRFKELTQDAHVLRQPVFLRMRDDKGPEECRIEDDAAPGDAEPPLTVVQPDEQVQLTNLDKVFWPDDGYVKGDLVSYYQRVSEWLLPYLEDRPLVMTRYPDGVGGNSFYQKDAPYAPNWVRTVKIWSDQSQRDIEYLVCESPEALTYVANLGAILLHVWSSRAVTLDAPDWCILDLDPKSAPFTDVIRIAQAIRDLCDAIDLPSFVKTSGSSGLHVLLPLGGKYSYEQSRGLAQLMARVIAAEHPEIATVTRQVSRREGRVYIDYVQNGHGRLLVAPFSVRPLPGAPVSTPLEWEEVEPGLTMDRFSIQTVPERLSSLAADPLLPILSAEIDMEAALERLGKWVSGRS